MTKSFRPICHFHHDHHIKFTALFDPSVKYQLIELYGLNCYTETNEGLLFEFMFTNRDYLVTWLLGFGSMVKVLEPEYIAEDIRRAAKIFYRYTNNTTDVTIRSDPVVLCCNVTDNTIRSDPVVLLKT